MVRHAVIEDMAKAEIHDSWRMATQGGPREVALRVGQTLLEGRFDPISESWLRRRIPPLAAHAHTITWQEA